MRPLGIFLSIALLLGCGAGSNNGGLGYSYDVEHDGLRVRYADTSATGPSAEHLFAIYTDALRCADNFGPASRKGIAVNPPLVIIVAPGTNDPYDGLTYYASGTITLERQWVGDRGLWVHEFERWISYSRGVPVDKVDGAPELQCQAILWE
jgi:hypothetical protein